MSGPPFKLPSAHQLLLEDPDLLLAFYGRRLPQPEFKVGEWVVWRRLDGPRMARVAKITQDGPWRPFVYHLRLREPIVYTGGRRWAYHANGSELRLPDAVDRLAQLAG